jgi:phosphatidylinositol alpha-mannosyltransferase
MNPLKSTPPKAASLNIAPKLKIGFVLDDSLDRAAGVQQYILTLSEWLESQGHELHYIVSTTSRTDLEHIHSLSRNIPVRFNGNYLRIPLPASHRSIKRLLQQEQFDVLHIQVPYSPFLGGMVIDAVDHHTAVIGTFHIVPKSALVSIASRLLSLLYFRSLKRFDEVVSVSTPAQQFAARAFHLHSSILPNVVNYQKFRFAKPFSSLKSSNRINIIFLGQLVPRKGCLKLLEAAMLLRKIKPLAPFMVTVCGEGPLERSLKQFVLINGLEGIVNFTGFVSEKDKLRYYASADIAVFPSMGGESFGIVLLEAMASGRAAVLAGDNPGYRSLLNDCPGDVLFDPHDASALAQKLHMIIKNTELRSRITEWQNRRAHDFDVETFGPKLLTIYRSALQRRSNVQ